MEKDKLNLKMVIITAGACLSFIIGAGTISGQEIIQFLTSFGYWGIGGCIISLVLYAWYTATLLRIGYQLNVQTSLQAFQYILGKKLGLVFEYLTTALVFLFFVVMLSGAGSTITQFTGLPELYGRVADTAVVFVVALLGLEKLVQILGHVGPFIIVFGTLIGIISFLQNLDGFKEAGAAMETIELARPYGINSWIISAVAYVAFTIVIAVPFYTKLGSSTPSKKDANAAGIAVGIAFMCVAGSLYLSMLSSIREVYNLPIPTLALAAGISPVFEAIFAVLSITAMLSTAIPLCWTVCEKVGGSNILRYRICAVVVCIIGFFGALLPFATIINTVYPLIGVLGFILMIGMFYRRYINKGTIVREQ